MATVVRLVHQHLHHLEELWLSIQQVRQQVAAIVQLETAGRLRAAGVEKVSHSARRLRVLHDVESLQNTVMLSDDLTLPYTSLWDAIEGIYHCLYRW